MVWIQGPAGAGKTTLVASWLGARKRPALWYQLDAGDADPASFFYYLGQVAAHAAPRHRKPLPLLTPEFLAAVPVFARRYFEELFGRLKTTATVVFDNYQDVPPESGFHEMLAHALEAVPTGVTVVILSRGEPPPAFARLLANHALERLGWDDIRFTLGESRELLRAHGRRRPSDKDLRTLHARTEGWAAGLILLLEREAASGIGGHDLDRLTTDGIFDYFASQIFDRTSPRTQRFLLTVAFLPSMTTPLARELAGIDDAGEVLERLARHHYFTQKHAGGEHSYQFHALFREFLLARAQTSFDAAERRRIKRKAAALLQARGLTEHAATLFRETEDWAALAGLIRSEAPTLLAQGRSQTLEPWIRAVPDEIRDHDAGLLYWLGQCRMAYDPRESRQWLEKGFAGFRAENQAAEALLAWASIIDTFTYEWRDFTSLDHWIEAGEGLLAVLPPALPPELEARAAAGMLTAMMHRQPGNPEAPRWAERVERIVLTARSNPMRMALASQLLSYYLWVRDFSRIAVVIDALHPASEFRKYDPLTKQNWYIIEAAYAWFVADWATCSRAIADGLNNADESGIHLLDLYLLAQGVYGGLSLGDPAAADSCLAKMARINSPRLGDQALYQYQASCVAWYHGDFRKAIEHGRQAVRITTEMGWPIASAFNSIELAVTLFDNGDYDEAEAWLARGVETCPGLIGVEFVACMNGARFAFQRGREEAGFELLRRALALGARHGFLNMPRWHDGRIAVLLARALERDIEPGYVRHLIRRRGLIPPADVAVPESWPYPLRIRAFGTFEVVRDGIPVRVSASAQQKPFALLKVLVAYGGKEVPDKRITDALWPDADGDYARNSFKVTLHRLRKLLGSDDFIAVNNGRVSLDAHRIWVDAWNFERLLVELESVLKAAPLSSAAPGARPDPAGGAPRYENIPALASQVLALNRGPFLEGETASWAVAARERLRTRSLRVVIRAGEVLAVHDPAAAMSLYEKALEVDPLAEQAYQGLMRCYRDAGRNAEGLSVYRRCLDVLRRELDITPSSVTETLRAALQGR